MSSSPFPSPAWAANAVCMLSMLVWAMGLPAASLLLGTVPPLPLTAARMLMAAACLLPFWWLIEGTEALRKAPWWNGIRVGGSTIGLGAFLMVVGQGMTDAVTVAIISASMPVVGIAIEVLLDGRNLSRGLVIGVALSLLGGVMALEGGNQQLALGLGALMSFASVLVYTLGSRMTVTSFPDLSPLGRTTVTLTGAAVVTTVAACIAAFAGAPAPQWAALGWRELYFCHWRTGHQPGAVDTLGRALGHCLIVPAYQCDTVLCDADFICAGRRMELGPDRCRGGCGCRGLDRAGRLFQGGK